MNINKIHSLMVSRNMSRSQHRNSPDGNYLNGYGLVMPGMLRRNGGPPVAPVTVTTCWNAISHSDIM